MSRKTLAPVALPPEQAQQASKVLALRRAGISFEAIADRLDLDPEAVRPLFDTALAATDPEFLRSLEVDRIDRLHAAVWPRALQGDLDAIDRVLKLSERRERVGAAPRVNDHAMRSAFDLATQTSRDVLDGLDAAIVAAGRNIADRVDEAIATGEGQEVTKALYLIPHMINVLREMLATPAARAKVEGTAPAPPPAVTGKLAQLRAVQGKRAGA